MAGLRHVEQLFIEELFAMGSGYVLDFSDRTFGQFFTKELGVGIDSPEFRTNGNSKAKRLRRFLEIASDTEIAKAIECLWEYRETRRLALSTSETVPRAADRLKAILERLRGHPDTSSKVVIQQPVLPVQWNALISEFGLLMGMDAHPRGFAFEDFLKRLFSEHGLAPRGAFRLVGEQIDGSFKLEGETYLLEAKWQNGKVGISELHTFHGKVEQKAAWTRGLIISYSGFSDDGLVAFGKGKRLICMDGHDLYEVVQRQMSLIEALNKKIRAAAETGRPFVRLAELT